MLELEAGDATVSVSPLHGGRVAQITVGETALLKGAIGDHPMTWGSFPMAPWAGRIRHGTFTFDDRIHRLPRNLEPHAIHGSVFTHPWTVEDAGRDYCELSCPLDGPFGGFAHQHLQLDPDGLTCMLSVTATRPMPVVIGWHPCFRKPLAADLEFEVMLPRDHEGIPTGHEVAPTPHPWDDCFRSPVGPLRLHYPSLTVTLSSDCAWWVVYDEPDDATCVEPQSAPPDAVNLAMADVLDTGDLLQRHFRLAWQRSATHR